MLKHRATKPIDPPISMGPSDTLSVTYTDEIGDKFLLDTIKTERYMLVDTISFFDVKDELGFIDGIAAIVGESKKG